MKKSKWFNKQYILLSVSILLGLIVLILGSSYAYYIVNITGNDDNNDVAVKTSNINLEVSNISGSLKLCKSYPISDSEAKNCTPYQFTITNNNKVSLEYYLNLEYQTSAPEDTIKVAFAECEDSSCTNPTYNMSKLSEILDNNDTILTKYTGKLLTTGNDFNQGDSKTYSVILWIDEESKYEEDTFTSSITAITYTQTQDILSYTLSFDLEDNATWTTDTCKSSDGYAINGTKCEKTIGVNEPYGYIPQITANEQNNSWYTRDNVFSKQATINTKYTLKANQIYYNLSYSFANDSWETIANNVRNGYGIMYKIGSEKEVEIDGTSYTVRLVNNTTPSECNQDDFSQTACGFVVEFVDILEERKMNSTNTNVGGWPATEMRTYSNNTFLQKLPNDLQNVIIDTKVISGHATTAGETNFTTTDKIYLLSTHEIWEDNMNYDTAYANTRQLDYYKSKDVTTSNYSSAIKLYNNSNLAWWLRAADSTSPYGFLTVNRSGFWGNAGAADSYGFAPIFRIG